MEDATVRLRLMLWAWYAARKSTAGFKLRWYDGLRVWVYPGNDLSWTIFASGCFEPNAFALLDRILLPGMTFVDAGANDGLYTLFAARRVGETGKVLAFEPSRREFERMSKNIELNRLRNVRTFQAALGDRTGIATLLIAGYGHEGHNTLGEFVYESGLEKREAVDIRSLDEVVRSERIERVDFIKADVEGCEAKILKGAEQTIIRDRPLLLIELNDELLRKQESSKGEILSRVHEWDYRLYFFDPLSGRPVEGADPPDEDPNIFAVHCPRVPEIERAWSSGCCNIGSRQT